MMTDDVGSTSHAASPPQNREAFSAVHERGLTAQRICRGLFYLSGFTLNAAPA